MDILKNKQGKSYDYISRYASFQYSYNPNDQKYIYEITSQLNKNSEYIIHKVFQQDTLDSIANQYYGRPDLFWVIADFNNIQDPFINIYGRFEELKVPSITTISFKK